MLPPLPEAYLKGLKQYYFRLLIPPQAPPDNPDNYRDGINSGDVTLLSSPTTQIY